MHGECEEVRIAEALADPGRLAEHVAGRREISGGLVLHHEREQHVTALDGVGLPLLEQPQRAAGPAGRAAHIAPEREPGTDPERRAQRARNLARVRVELIGALETAQPLVLASEQVGSGGETLEILGSEPAFPIRQRERLVGIPPCSFGVSPATTAEVIGRVDHVSELRMLLHNAFHPTFCRLADGICPTG